MHYNFHVKLTTQTDTNLSFKIMKHPANEFERTFENVYALGRFTRNESTVNELSYEIMLEHRLKELPNSDRVTWNFIELSAFSLRELNVAFNNVLRSALRGHVDSLITEEIVNETHHYQIEIAPVDPGAFKNIEKFEKYQQIANQLGLNLNYQDENNVAIVETVDAQTVKHFLQKSYLLVFSMLAKYSILSQLTKDKVEQIVNMSSEWIEQISDKSLHDYFVRNLLQYKLGLIEKFNEESETDVDKNVKLHELKHNLITEYFNSTLRGFFNPEYPLNVVEFGCSSGQLAKRFSNLFDNGVNYIGIDSNYKMLEKAKRKLRKNKTYHFVKNDFLYDFVEDAELSDLLLLVEVIEHLNEFERDRLVKIVTNVYKPEFVVITTPNVDYNVNYGLADGQYRHSDHKIEFNEEQFNEYLEQFSNYSVVKRFKLTDEEIDPSFVVILQQIKTEIDEAFVKQFKLEERQRIEEIAAMQSQFLMPGFDYIVTQKELRNGMESRHFNMNSDHVFYLGPTMAPADCKQFFGRNYEEFVTDFNLNGTDIESPHYALQYYNSKGLSDNDLVAEVKYMGSRAYILAFKNEEIAQRFEMPVITINSRNGYTFFDEENQNIVSEIYDVITKSFFTETTGLDFIALDCEITPWKLKAKNLIYYDFELPVQLQLSGFTRILNSETFADKVAANVCSDYLDASVYCYKFLNTLEHFTKDTTTQVYVFDVLASGSVNGRKVEVITNRETDRIDVNYWLNDNLIKNDIVRIATQTIGSNALDLWNSLDDSFEGIVIKPRKYVFKNGSAILPYMKCRRDSYMSLVYSPFFYAGEYSPVLNKVYWRNIAKKRRASMFQDELSHLILKAFFKNDKMLLKKYIAAFYANDNNGNFGGIDPTL